MRAVADAHDGWVAGNLDAPFDPAGRPDDSVYNQHYVDLDADGAAQDAYADQVAAVMGAQTAAIVDEHGNHHSERDGRFVRKGGGAARRLSNIAKALESGEPDALASFNREQLQREVRRLNREGAGIKLRRGASEDEIKDVLRAHADVASAVSGAEAPSITEQMKPKDLRPGMAVDVSQLYSPDTSASSSGIAALNGGESRFVEIGRIVNTRRARTPGMAGFATGQYLILDRAGEPLGRLSANSTVAAQRPENALARRTGPTQADKDQAQANMEALMDTARVREAKLKLERAEKMHGSDRSKWSKKDRDAAAKLDKVIAGGSATRTDGLTDAQAADARARANAVAGLPLDGPTVWERRAAEDQDRATQVDPADGGRARQARIDAISKRADTLGGLHQLMFDNDDPDALRRRLQWLDRRDNLAGDPVMSQLLQADTSDRAAFRKALDDVAGQLGLSRIGGRQGTAHGRFGDFDVEVVTSNPKEHRSNGEYLPPGTEALVVRPGFHIQLPGEERLVLEKAIIEPRVKSDRISFPEEAAESPNSPTSGAAPELFPGANEPWQHPNGPAAGAADMVKTIQQRILSSPPNERGSEEGAEQRARDALAPLKKDQLLEVAERLQVPVSKSAAKAKLISDIVGIMIGWPITSRSIERPTLGGNQTAAADDGETLDAAFSAALEAAMELGDDATEEEFAAEFLAEFASRMPEHLQRYWAEGAGMARVRWFVRGAFRRCRRVLRAEGVPGRMLDGTCANLYHRATGRWPGRGKTQTAAVEVDEFAALDAAELAELVDILTEEMDMGEDHGTQTACGCGGGASVAEPPSEMAADDGQVWIWEGPLAPMSTPTGDAEPRMFAPGALSGRGLPRALRWQERQERGHDGAVAVGALTHYWLDDRGTPWGRAYFFDENVIPEAGKARYLAEHGVVAPSVDLEPSMDVAFTDEEGNQFNPMTCAADGSCPARPRSMITRGTIASATLVPIAAFGELGSGRLYRGPQPVVDAYRSATQIAAVRFGGWDDMPIADKSRTWDAAAAERRIADWAAEGDGIDWERYGQAFLWHATPADSKGAFKFPVADVIEDELVIIPRAVFAAAARVGQASIPAEDQDAVREAISDIYDQMAEELDDDDLIAPWDDDREEMSVQGCGCASKIGAMVPDGTQTAAAGCTSCGSKYGVFGNLEPYPADAFGPVRFDQLTPVHIEQRPGEAFARVVGHVGDWKGCHRSFKHVCVPPPKSRTNYAEFHTAGHVRTPDGLLRVGKVVMGEGHPDSSVPARIARAYYDATSKEIAHVRGYEDQFGPYINGVLAPGVTPEEATTFLASPVSGDWKNHEMIAVLAVNVGGHPIRTSATFDANGVPRNVVAAGRFWLDEDDDAEVQAAAEVLWRAEHRTLLEMIG